MTMTQIEADLLQSGLAVKVRIYGELIPVGDGLSRRGLAVVTGVRTVFLKTTGDGAVALSRHKVATARKDFSGITATEVNEFLGTLPEWVPE